MRVTLIVATMLAACDGGPAMTTPDAQRPDSPSTDGGDHAPDGSTAAVVVMISPRSSTVRTGAMLTMSATVTGTTDSGVDFSIEEPSGCGTIAGGLYSAPPAVPSPAVCHARATSHADPSSFDRAALTIVDTVATGTPGVWENVTPAGISVDPGFNPATNFGVQDVLTDPARPSDLYAFTCYQGVWRSTDYGASWSLISTGTNSTVLMDGRMWGAAIEPSPLRDSSTPPTLYTFNGYGSTQGLFKSTNGGVDWDHIVLPDGANGDYPQDAYDIDIDPYDAQHLLVGYHGSGLSESTDGGAHWQPIVGSEANGGSPYVFFIDTGSADTTARTWITVAQWESNTHGVHVTHDAGASWDQIGLYEHGHGDAQIFNAGAGTVYVIGIGGGLDGVYRSTDSGAHWTQVSTIGGNTVIATPNFFYSSAGWANADGADPAIATAPRGDDTHWTLMTVPAEMTNGAKRMAVTYDGTHYILVNGSWNAGIWRYVEP